MTTNNYTQTFDKLNVSGTAPSTVVTPGSLYDVNPLLNGWYFYETGSGANNTIAAGTGTVATGNTYSFGATGSTDRTLGSLRSSLVSTFGFYFTNNTSSAVTSIQITYVGKTWRIGTMRNYDRLDFQYSTDATSLTMGTWIDSDGFDYQNNTASTPPSSGSLLQSSVISGTMSINIPIGSSVFIRWNDFDATGADDGMGVDDFTLTLNPNPLSTTTPTDQFQATATNGNWSDVTTWQSYNTTSGWITATLVPTRLASSISIPSGKTVTITQEQSAKKLTVDGTLTYSTTGIKFYIGDDGTTAIDLTISATGNYLLYGVSPILDAAANAEIYGIVKVISAVGGSADAFASNSQILFKTGSYFIWHTISAFSASGITYFNASGAASEKPIFRVDTSITSGFVGGSSPTIFNGKFELYHPTVPPSMKFSYSGAKNFRDGIGGNGTFTKNYVSSGSVYNCGPINITGANAVIDGSLSITINGNSTVYPDLEFVGNVTTSGSVSLAFRSTDTRPTFNIDGVFLNNSSTPIDLLFSGGTMINIYGRIDKASTGKFKSTQLEPNDWYQAGGYYNGYANTRINVLGSGGSAGTLKFVTSTFSHYNLIDLTMNRPDGRIELGSDIAVDTFVLTKGKIITNDYLFTYRPLITTGTEGSPYTPPTSYLDAFVCTCNGDNTALSLTSPFDGSKGFKLRNVQKNIDAWFPVSADTVSPNRMYIKNTDNTSDDYIVVVGKGDVLNTPLPRVNRIWYVKNTSSTAKATMRLYFRKRDWTNYPVSEDEVEAPFDYGDIHLVQETYSNQFINNSNSLLGNGNDVQDFSGSAIDAEIYAQYTVSVSQGLKDPPNGYPVGSTTGINQFSRFSVVNARDIILPVTLVDFKAYAQGSDAKTQWTALNETNIDHYEVERSADGINFITIGSVKATNSGSSTTYTWLDKAPLNGNNFYRIKTAGRNEKISYTNVINVPFEITAVAVKVYPNPVVNHRVNLLLNNLAAGNYTLEVYSISGQLVTTQKLQHAVMQQTTAIELPFNTAHGIYVCVSQAAIINIQPTLIYNNV